MSTATLLMVAAMPQSLWSDYFRAMLVLGGICLIALVAIKNVLPKLFVRKSSTSTLIQAVGRLQLEPQKTLYVIKVGNTYSLVGTSSQAIHYLRSIQTEETAELSHDSRRTSPPQ